MKVALIIIYNHQYNKNIDIIEKIYKDRFSDIYHLVPFYNGEKGNVIPVYESSYYFQGYVSQGLHRFFREEYTHYFFIGDDLLLNPEINENSYHDIFKLGLNTSFIPNFITLHDFRLWHARIGDAFKWNIKERGVEAQNMLPDYEMALDKFSKFGLTIKPFNFLQVVKLTTDSCLSLLWKRDFGAIYKRCLFFCKYLSNKVHGKPHTPLYPMVAACSDIFILSAKSIKDFCFYSGVFATTKLFVEIALPTSVVLSSEEIVTKNDLGLQGKAWQCSQKMEEYNTWLKGEIWSKEDHQKIEKCEHSLPKLLAEFPSNYLYLHPVKLSKWKTEK